ncbi:LysE family translocator [Phytopseudomonas flavescens]
MVSNSLNHGLRRSLPSIIGGLLASICLLSASALGLGALLLASEQLFSLLKVLGALYLFYLAWHSWRASREATQPPSDDRVSTAPYAGGMFWKAFGLGASNPKDILFFAAFLPQFISASQPFFDQLLVLIITWATLDLACKLFYALSARGAARYLRSAQGQVWFNRVSAGLFGAAGGAALLSR